MSSDMEIPSRQRVFMRPPRITNIGKDEYSNVYWPKIEEAIKQVILQPERTISQEELYRTIYNVCCQRHTVTIYTDLLRLMESYLFEMHNSLMSTPDEVYVFNLCKCFINFKRVSELICIVFRYMDKIYVNDKLQTTLQSVLYGQLNTVVASKADIQSRSNMLLKVLPSNSDPTMMMELVKLLYELDKSYSSFNPNLFAMYIPCFQPSRGFQLDLKETLELIAMLRNQGYGNPISKSDYGLKRKYYIAEIT